MDKPNHKDGMLAAGKKRLEQFRQKKAKGSSSKQNSQETDIEHGRSRSEVEHASHKGSEATSNTCSNDSEGSKAKGSRMQASNENQVAANSRFGDGSKEFPIDVNVVRSGDRASSKSTGHSSASDLDSSANAFHAEANTLEQRTTLELCRVAGEDVHAVENGECYLTIDDLVSSQLHPTSSLSITGHSEKPTEEDCLDSAGAPDLSINMADLVAPDVGRNHNLTSVEQGASELNSKGIVMSSSSPDFTEAFQVDQKLGLEPCGAGFPPCSSSDHPAVIAAERMSEYGNEMQTHLNAEATLPGLNYFSSQVLNSSQSTSKGDEEDTSQPGHDFDTKDVGMIPGFPTTTDILNSSQSTSKGDEEDTSQPGHDFDTRDVGMIPGFPTTTDILEKVAQGASKEEEQFCSSESNERTYFPIESIPVDFDTDVATASISDPSLTSKTSNVENASESHSEGTVVGSVLNESCNFEQTQTGKLDLLPESSLGDGGPVLTNDHGFEGSEDSSTVIVEVATELHPKGIATESVSNDSEKPHKIGELDAVPRESVSDYGGLSLSNDHEFKESESAAESHSEGILAVSVFNESCSSKQPQTVELDVSMVGAPASRLDHEGHSPTNDHEFKESQDASYQDGVPVLQREGIIDKTGVEGVKVLGASEFTKEILDLDSDNPVDLVHKRTLSVEKSSENHPGSSVALLASGESCSEQEGLKPDDVSDQFPEIDKSTTANYYKTGTDLGDNNEMIVSGSSLDPEQGAWGAVNAESSTSNSQELFSGDNLRFLRSLEVVGAEQATEEGQIKGESTHDRVENAGVFEADVLCSVHPSELKDYSPPLILPEEITVLDAVDQATLESEKSHEGPIVDSDNGSGIEIDNSSTPGLVHVAAVLRAAEDVKGFDGSMNEMIVQSTDDMDVQGHSLEEEEGTGPFQRLDSPSAAKEVAGEFFPVSNSNNTGIAPFALVVDNSCLNPIVEGVRDPCTGSASLTHEIATPSLDAESDLATAQQRRDDVNSETCQLKLDSDSLPSPSGDELKLILRATVSGNQPDLEFNSAKPSQSFSDVEHMLAAHETSKFANHVELTGTDCEIGQETPRSSELDPTMQSSSTSNLEMPSESCKSYEAVYPLASPGDYVVEVPLFMNPNEACEQEACEHAVLRSFSENLDTDVHLDHNRNTEITYLIGLESRSIDKFNLLLEEVQVGQDIRVFDNSSLPLIRETGSRDDSKCKEESMPHKSAFSISSTNESQVKEGIESEDVIRELQDALCMKETELENITFLLNSQAATNFEERGKFVEVLTHVVNRLRDLVPQGSNVNGDADLHFQPLKSFDVDIPGSINFDHFVQGYDCWLDEMQKDLEGRRQMEATIRQLEDALSMKDSDIKELNKKVEELSLKCDELQKDSDENEQLESRAKRLEVLLTVKDTDIERLSNTVSEISHKCDLTMDEMIKAVEERLIMENNLKQLEPLLIVKDAEIRRLSGMVSELSVKCDSTMVEMAKAVEERANLDGELKQSKDLLTVKETDIGRLSDMVSELSVKCDSTTVEMAKAVEERANLDGELKQSKDLLTVKETDIGRISDRMSELSQKYDLTLVEMGKVLEEKESLEGELKHSQNLYVEQESKACHLKELLLIKDTDLESLQKLYAEEREGFLFLRSQVSALTDKVTALLSPAIEAVDADAIGTLEILVASLHDQFEAVFRENKDLSARASKSDAAYEIEVENLRALISAKEVELNHVQEQVDLLTKELSKTKEDGERKILEAEQKTLGARERLSLAVTKGKGLVQQRDNLKQLLAEKTGELEALTTSYQQELHAKMVALNEAESKAKLNLEAGERVEALESELSYIRNSANALRESFLQKDAVLQKIEELLEDASLPEELQIKDTHEKVEWLLEASNQKTVTAEEGPSEIATTRGLDTFSLVEQPSQMQEMELEQLNRKCDELVRKYRGMAEQSAMLEQSLLERNQLIQKWEEMLDTVDMPASVRSKEPEDKIQWLDTSVSDAHNSIARLQADTDNLQTTVDTLNHSFQKLQEQNSVLSAELMAKEDELRAVVLDLEDMTMKFNSLSKSVYESSDEACRPAAAGTRDFEASENNQEEGQQEQFQIGNLDSFISKIRLLLSEVLKVDEVDNIFAGVSASTAFESSLKLLVGNSKVWLAEATEAKEKLSELTLAMRQAEVGKKEFQSLHDALSSKTLELNNLNMQLEGSAAKITFLEDEVGQLQKEVQVKSEELSFVRDELNKSQLEVSQGDEKLSSVREKLSMAVKKGKSVVQQRDTLKHTLDEKVAELDQLRKDYEAESLASTKAKQSFKHQLQELEAELTSSRKYATSLEKSIQDNNKTIQKFGEFLDKIATSAAPRSGDLMEKIQWISQLVLDLQRKAGFNEQEAKKSKKATELLALELEEVQGRMDSLADELMHAEKNISLLIEEKKLAEASKAEAGLRLEHAMANVNSLLFELSESKEAQENLEQENSSLKDSLSAQMEEIRSKHTKAEDQLKELTDLNNKMHVLKANQSIFIGRVADKVFKLSEDMRGTKNLIVRISGELKEQGFITSLASAAAFVEKFPSKWEPEFPSKEKTAQEWKQGVTTGSLRLLCEEMEIEFQHFDMFLNDFVIALNKESAVTSQLLSELCNGLGLLTKKLETLKRDAAFASSTESLIVEKDEQIRILEEIFQAVSEKLSSSVEEVEGFKEGLRVQISGSFVSPFDGGLPFTSAENLQNIIVSLVERLSSSVKDLAQSCQQAQKQNEDLRCQLREAKEVIDAMGQQQQTDRLKLQKCLEEFEGKDDILKRTNQELCSLHDSLTTKKQEEMGLVEALEKAETNIGELSGKVEELEKAKQELEASLGKASSRFHATVSNFNKFQSLSEKLIEEAESLHLLLEGRDAQISVLNDEVAHKTSEMINLQNLVNERTTDLSQVYQHIGGIVNRDASNGELLADPGRRKEILEALATSVRAGTESLRVQLARKDALLQDIQLRHDDLARKVLVLESSVQENQRLMEERGATEHMMITVEAEEKGNRGKHSTPSVALVTHGRGGRKVSATADHSVLDVDAESGRLLADVDVEDKGHVFKPLTSSRLVPRGTRILVDRLDGFWVSGERLLRRRPGARLSVMLYWLVLHVWMVAILL